MSVRAMSWAAQLPHGRVSALGFRVLLLLADHAHDDGTAAWKSVSAMAEALQVSERSIQRALAELRESGLIRPGDQRLLAHIPEGKRPGVYDLDYTAADQLGVTAAVTGDTPEKLSTGVTAAVASYIGRTTHISKKTSRSNHTEDVTPPPFGRCPGNDLPTGLGPHTIGRFGKCIHCHAPIGHLLELEGAHA